MVFVWDSNVLCLALHPQARSNADPDAAEKVQFMLESLSDRKDIVIIPTPVLAEFLILAESDGPKYLTTLKESSVFRIESFDERAAIELADMEIKARQAGSKRGSAAATSSWQKIKIDRQIVAIAKVFGVNSIYSDDPDVEALAKDCNMRVTPTKGLPMRPSTAQGQLIPPAE